MKILYLSDLASPDALVEARNRDPQFSSYAVNKFNRLVVEGFARNGHQVTALSTFHQPNVGFGYYRHNETINGVNYHYVVSANFKPLRYLWLMIFCFCRVLCWGIFNNKNKVLVCDALNRAACTGALAAARLIGLRRVGILTDMPGLNVRVTDDGKQHMTLAVRVNMYVLKHFTHYVFLTEQMNGVVNIHNRPYIVMEGLVDADIYPEEKKEKVAKKILIYAGGLYERYGLKMLVDGFLKADIKESELWIYGKGPFVSTLLEYCKVDTRIIYKGICPNDEVVNAEKIATLLVNPRPTHEAFTKYSFPSKNMEYMVSGTALLTTRLPGMPTEYYPYVYLFDQGETTDGYADVLRRILTLSNEELASKGAAAQRWVISNKNNIVQTARIVKLVGE